MERKYLCKANCFDFEQSTKKKSKQNESQNSIDFESMGSKRIYQYSDVIQDTNNIMCIATLILLECLCAKILTVHIRKWFITNFHIILQSHFFYKCYLYRTTNHEEALYTGIIEVRKPGIESFLTDNSYYVPLADCGLGLLTTYSKQIQIASCLFFFIVDIFCLRSVPKESKCDGYAHMTVSKLHSHY